MLNDKIEKKKKQSQKEHKKTESLGLIHKNHDLNHEIKITLLKANRNKL